MKEWIWNLFNGKEIQRSVTIVSRKRKKCKIRRRRKNEVKKWLWGQHTEGEAVFVLTAPQLCMCSRVGTAKCGAHQTDSTAGDDNVPSCRSESCNPDNPGPAVDNIMTSHQLQKLCYVFACKNRPDVRSLQSTWSHSPTSWPHILLTNSNSYCGAKSCLSLELFTYWKHSFPFVEHETWLQVSQQPATDPCS